MAKDFWIDTSDPPYPTIRHRTDPKFESEYSELMTLTQARREIKNMCRQHRQHWLSVMNYQISRSPEVILQEAGESE